MTTPNEELILKLRGQAYTTCRPDQLCDQAADALQSQAERIKELESEVEMWKATANAVVDFEKVQLRAEIAAIAATEPVAYRWVWKSKPWDIEGWCYTNTPPTLPELQEIEPLFTRPMPAQGVEASMIELPEPDDTYCGVNYYTESQLKQAVSDALDAELVKDAKRMAQQVEPVAQARLGMKDGLAMALSVVELYGMKGDVIYREIAKLRDGIAAAPAPQAQQGEPVCHGCGIPAGDVHMSTCKSGKWPSRVSNGDTAAPAQSAQQAATKNCPQPAFDKALAYALRTAN